LCNIAPGANVRTGEEAALKVIAYLNCLMHGHSWHISRSKPGVLTCSKCRAHKRIP
jgi:hypothetical protein